jgi:HAD superfamily hydrolase (TIGR01549 family)
LMSAVVVDVDGTLVDTNYQHALAWYRAFRRHGLTLQLWRIHRHIGMGGDHLVAALAGRPVEEELGDDIRSTEKEIYKSLIDEVEPMEGSRELLVELKRRGHSVVLASSAKEEEVEHYLDLLQVRDVIDARTSSADVSTTKPAPDLIEAALERVGGGDAIMLGDSTFDCEAAGNAGVKTIGVLTGGFSEQELRDAGAIAVFASIDDLRRHLDETPLA